MDQTDQAEATPSRLRIAFVTDRFGRRFGGAESYGVALMQELAQHHDVTVVASAYDPDCALRLPWIRLRVPAGLPGWVRALWVAVCARRATRQGFDLVHSHINGWCGDVEVVHVTPVRFGWRVQPVPWIKRLLSCVSLRVQTYLALEAARFRPRADHQGRSEKPGRQAGAADFSDIPQVVAVSDLIAKQLCAAYGQRAFPVIVPGVSPASPQAPQWRSAIRHALGLGDTDMMCLMVARDPVRKGLATVLQALRQLPGDTFLVLVGGDAAARAWFSRSPHADALRDRVKLLDALADVRPYYAAADCCLHPTLNDSFGMAPLEAMAYGLPVVLSPMPYCGFAQYVQHDCNALVLDHPENVSALADFIAQLSAQPALRQRLGEAARALAQQYSWLQVAARYQALYAQILRARSNT